MNIDHFCATTPQGNAKNSFKIHEVVLNINTASLPENSQDEMACKAFKTPSIHLKI